MISLEGSDHLQKAIVDYSLGSDHMQKAIVDTLEIGGGITLGLVTGVCLSAAATAVGLGVHEHTFTQR